MISFKTTSIQAFSATVLCAVALGSSAQSVRNQISIVGSSTVYPFSTVVAEQFGRTTSFKTPTVESTGSGGGLKLFCSGIGTGTPDIANSSRRIKSSEVSSCESNGVSEIIEVKIGYDGIVVANSVESKQLSLTTRDLFLALAKNIPDAKNPGKLIANPNQKWSDVRAELPSVQIEVLGPPPTSGTRDAFVELAMESGCSSFEWIDALASSDKNRFQATCHTLREDGRFVEAGENDNLIVQKLQTNPDALGIFGFSFLDQNADLVQGSLINGSEPTFEAIADGEYAISRPLYVYVKKAHIGTIPGLKEFLQEFVSEKAMGAEGYLSDRGLIPLPDDEYEAAQSAVTGLKNLDLSKK